MNFLNQEFNRINFIKELSKKYNVELDKFFEALLDAETSRKEISKLIEISNKEYLITKTGIGPLTTSKGKFYQLKFRIDDEWKEYYVIIKAKLDKKDMIPKFDSDKEIYLRIDSGCSTGQIFCDLTCECRDQLDQSLSTLGKKEQGMVIYIPNQDGRGKGTEFKLATLYLQERLGVDTTESFMLLEKDNSNESLDCRTYDGAIGIMKFLGAIKNITMATNNPQKISALKQNKIKIRSESIIIEPTKLTYKHLRAKQSILGHKTLGVNNGKFYR